MQNKIEGHIKNIAKLEQYILDAPASNSEHQRALELLNSIIAYYTEKIQSLEEGLQRINKTKKNE